MTNTLVFDLGGVLIDNPSTEMFLHFEKVLGFSYNELYPAILKYWKDWEKGLIFENDLWEKVGADLGKKLDIKESLWLNGYMPAYRERKEMFDLLGKLKTKGYQTALLSNIEHPIKEYILTKNYQNFDRLIFSCEVNMSKPDTEIYEYALEQLKVNPDETIFIDDRMENVEAANSLGMKGVFFQDHSTLQSDLKKLNVL